MDANDRQALNDNLSKLSENCNFDNLLVYLENQFTDRQLQIYRVSSAVTSCAFLTRNSCL